MSEQNARLCIFENHTCYTSSITGVKIIAVIEHNIVYFRPSE